MKPLLLLAAFFLYGNIYSQDTIPSGIDQLQQQKQANAVYNLQAPAVYLLEKSEFTFTPETNRIHIRKKQEDGEIDFGDLRQTTDDGLYIMTSTLSEDVSFGRFDSIGNFRTLRYDQANDTVIEERYLIQKNDLQEKPDRSN